MDQALNSQKTPHTSPLRASYGMSFVSILMKNDRVIKGFYCIHHLALSSWSLRMDEEFHQTLCWACDYLSMLGWNFINISEWVIKFNSLSGDSGQRSPYSTYKLCNHNLYIGMIIFPHIDNPQSTGHNLTLRKKISKKKHKKVRAPIKLTCH